MSQSPRIKVAMVTNIPAPYRIPVYERVAQRDEIELCVFFCSGREPDREWDLQDAGYRQVFFKEKFLTYRGRFIHANPDVWARLKAFAPEVIITTGFNPTFLMAYLYALVHGVEHVAMTDGTHFTEQSLSRVHRWVRRWVYGGSRAFIGASQGSFQLYRSYGLSARDFFQSHLCANNAAYEPVPEQQKRYDFVFSARFVGAKNPIFAMSVAQAVAKCMGRRIRLLMMGSGELDDALREHAQLLREDVEVDFAGFVKQADLPQRYASARVMLFPTQIDTWGVVANEAMAAGVPVLVTPMAGVADDLVLDGVNGRVLPLVLSTWVEAAVQLLQDEQMRLRYAAHGVQHVQNYSYEHAAQGICDAVHHVSKARP